MMFELHLMRRQSGLLTAFLAVAGLCAARPLGAQTPARSAPSFDVVERTIDHIHVALRSGGVTCRDVVQQYLDRIAAYNHQRPTLNAVQTVNARALAEADRLDSVAKVSGE